MFLIAVLAACLVNVASDSAGTLNTPSVFGASSKESNCSSDGDCSNETTVCYKTNCYSCNDCCYNETSACHAKKCFCGWWLTDDELKVVAQAVLGIAVFVTCVALTSLLWKMCIKRLRRQRVAASGVAADLLDDTTSLSSDQVFVVDRLRNRPPRYEEAARDFVVEKPPAYAEAVGTEGPLQLEQQPYRRTVLVGNTPVTLVGVNLTARDFVAPPSYADVCQVPPTVLAPGDLLAPPQLPSTPPVQRLRRCVRKVVVIRRIGRSGLPPREGTGSPKVMSRQLPGDSISTGDASHGTATSDTHGESGSVSSCSESAENRHDTGYAAGGADEVTMHDNPSFTVER